jgi:hypothetical protein
MQHQETAPSLAVLFYPGFPFHCTSDPYLKKSTVTGIKELPICF